MAEVVLDGLEIRSVEEVHDRFAQALDLPDYYGRNLDALFDCLTDRREAMTVRLLHREALEVESLGSYDIVLLASPDFTETDFTTPGQRKAVSLVTDEPDSIFRRHLEAYLRQREIELDVTLELWSIETIKRCVMSNLGFTYLPRFVAEEELADGRLAELKAPISGVPAPALCAWRKGRWVTPAMELFLELLREALAEG